MLSELIELSKTEFIFVETNTNNLIPIKNCKLNGRLIIGDDFINNSQFGIQIDNIIGYFSIKNENHNIILKQKNHYKNLKEIIDTDNLINYTNFFYKKMPLFKKIISISINCDFDEISLDILKDFWKEHILKFTNKFEEYILSEINDSDNSSYTKELKDILKNLKNIKKFKEINTISSKENLCKYWPEILMPAPSFVDTEIYNSI